jgi:hypothetical protein
MHKDNTIRLGDMVIFFKRMFQKLLNKVCCTHKQELHIMQGKNKKLSPEVWKD